VVEVVGDDWEPPAGERRLAASGAATSRSGGDGLNPKYSFEQFVIGDGNRFAHAAALAWPSCPPGLQPALPARPPGLGKTHLLHAIGNYVERFGAGLQVRYATIEEFTSEFVDAVAAAAPATSSSASASGRGADRRRPVPRRPRQDPRGVLPHLQLAARLGPPARDDLRPQPRGLPGSRRG
jgi:hypothetical protein